MRALFAAAFVASLLAIVSFPAVADEPEWPTTYEWRSYTHQARAFRVEVPTFLAEAGGVPEGDGRSFVSGSVSIVVWFDSTIAGQTDAKSALSAATARESKAGHEVTYEISKDNWYVVSGFAGDKIFYDRALISSGRLYHARLEYPKSLKGEMEPVLKRVTRSFRPGAVSGPLDLNTATETCAVLTSFSYPSLWWAEPGDDEYELVQDCEARLLDAPGVVTGDEGDARTDRIQLAAPCPPPAGEEKVWLLLDNCFVGFTHQHRRDIVCTGSTVRGSCPW